jgi:hypothetical protein
MPDFLVTLIPLQRPLILQSKDPAPIFLGLWREDPFFDQRSPECNSVGQIDREDLDRHFANGSFPHQHRAVPHEMVCPPICTRIEEPDVSSFEVPCDIRSLVRVAAFTAHRQIVSRGWATVFLSDDVVDLERKQGCIRRNLTILTPLCGPLLDKLPQFSIHNVLLMRALRVSATVVPLIASALIDT